MMSVGVARARRADPRPWLGPLLGPLLGLGVVLLAGVAGCAHAPGAPAIPACPGSLRPTQQIEGELRLRLRMRLQASELDAALELAVEKRGDELVVIGFDPFGVKSFSLVQRGLEVEVEGLPPAVLPTAPLNVLRDLHRARFLALETPPGGQGQVMASLDGVRITEHWSGGRLEWRRFERAGEAPESGVRVDFDGDVVRIENRRCGYRATLVELSAEPLP